MSKDCNAASLSRLKARVDALYLQYIFPVLATIRVGEAPEALTYEARLQAAAAEAGVRLRRYILPEDTAQQDLAVLIGQINDDPLLSSLLLLRPTPAQVDGGALQGCILPEKALEAVDWETLLEQVIDAAQRRAT